MDIHVLLTHTVGERDATVCDIREVSNSAVGSNSESFAGSTTAGAIPCIGCGWMLASIE